MSKQREELPIIISPTEKLSEPNQTIPIYTGEIELRGEKEIYTADVVVEFKWFPIPRVVLTGTVRSKEESFEIEDHKLTAYIDNILFGDCYVVNTYYKISENWTLIIEGFLSGDVSYGDTSVRVDDIEFSIPNLRFIQGERVAYEDRSGGTQGRSVFTHGDYEITIDAIPYCDKLITKLHNIGGYALTYGGRIKKLKGSISYGEAKEVLEAFSVFLSFVNGSQVNTLFHQGIFEGEIKWKGYKTYLVRSIVSTQTWLSEYLPTDLNKLWVNFHTVWRKNDDEREALRTAINWYLEGLRGAGYIEGGIMMTQTALELLYNWLLIDTMKLMRGSDAANISAANKIRLLLAQLKVEPSVPSDFKELSQFVTSSNEIEDAPDAIVQIRNAIVHAQLEKRKKLNSISSRTKYEALTVSLWYVELTILFILKYEGYYKSRVHPMTVDENQVPWNRTS